LAEEEVNKRTENAITRRIKAAKFPVIKTKVKAKPTLLDAFDFASQPSVNKKEIIQLSECHFIAEKNNIIFVGPCGTGKTHLSVAIGLVACSKGYKVFFDTAAGLINNLIEAKNEYRLSKKLAQLRRFDLIICDELVHMGANICPPLFLLWLFRDCCYPKSAIFENYLNKLVNCRERKSP